MRIFVSYARVDKPYCIQIVDTVDVHETWYDQRLYAGQNWWKEILRRLDWCEGFIYLLSSDSVSSEYCQKEFELAQSLGKHIFPVLIRDNTYIPDSLKDVQYVDLTKGITPDAVKTLLNSVYVAERQKQTKLPLASIAPEKVGAPEVDPATVISTAAAAMEGGQFDQAVFLLKQAKENGYTSRFINLDALLSEAETALERLTQLREAEKEYKQIAELIRHTRTRKLGLEAFIAFRQDYPDYDPNTLAQYLAANDDRSLSSSDNGSSRTLQVLNPIRKIPFTLPLLEWCEIPVGLLFLDESGRDQRTPQQKPMIDPFRISKYPITHGQYQVFRDDPNGYCNAQWWEFSPSAYKCRLNNPEPKPGRFKGEERPCEMVNWYDAMAFCFWLSSKLGTQVTLPTALDWQRAARGDDNRLYPWGNEFDRNRCNTRESEIKMTSVVMRYKDGVSPFNVYDMAGNVWEWCLNAKPPTENSTQVRSNVTHNPLDITIHSERAVFGGSFVSAYQRSQTTFHYYLDPLCYHATIGFRVVQKLSESKTNT
jgi:formylglycine-generating enzyme required for sulfatase activity